MNPLLEPPRRFHWTDLPTVAAGLFIGGFWTLTGLQAVLNAPGSWPRLANALGPGAAVMVLSMLARRAPVPYGVGLIALGAMPFAFFWMSIPWLLRLAFGLPVLAVGASFILWRDRFGA